MKDGNLENSFQGFSQLKTLNYQFKTINQQNNFIHDLFLIVCTEAHFSLYLTHNNGCIITLFSNNEKAILEIENKIAQIMHAIIYEKNRWWCWWRVRSK